MEGLKDAHFRQLLTAIEQLDFDCDLDGFPQQAMAAAAAIVQFERALYHEYDAVLGRYRFLLHPALPAAPSGRTQYRASAGLAPRRISGFLSQAQFRSLALHCGFYRCLDANYQMVTIIHHTPGRLVALVLKRGGTDFDKTEHAKLEVLRRHLSGHYVLAMRLAEQAQRNDHVIAENAGHLTRQEAVVLGWVGMGKTNGEVAAIVGSSPLTVKKHLEHIYQKLGVANRTAAARLWQE